MPEERYEVHVYSRGMGEWQRRGWTTEPQHAYWLWTYWSSQLGVDKCELRHYDGDPDGDYVTTSFWGPDA